MTKKHKLKKRVRTRMQKDGTSYSEALSEEREPKTDSPAKSALAIFCENPSEEDLREKMADLVRAEQLLIRDGASESRTGEFIDCVCALAENIYKGLEYPHRDFLLYELMDAASGIDHFWDWGGRGDSSGMGVGDRHERRVPWGDAAVLLLHSDQPSEFPAEDFRRHAAAGVRAGLTTSMIRSGPLPEELNQRPPYDLVFCCWDEGLDVWTLFGCRPRAYTGGGPTEEPQDAVVIRTVTSRARHTFVGTDDGIAEATAGLVRTPSVPELRNIERYKQQKVQQILEDRVNTILQYRKIGKRRGIAEVLVAIDDTGMTSLDFVNEVFAKVLSDESDDSDDLLREQLMSLLEPKVRAHFRIPSPTETVSF